MHGISENRIIKDDEKRAELAESADKTYKLTNILLGKSSTIRQEMKAALELAQINEKRMSKPGSIYLISSGKGVEPEDMYFDILAQLKIFLKGTTNQYATSDEYKSLETLYNTYKDEYADQINVKEKEYKDTNEELARITSQKSACKETSRGNDSALPDSPNSSGLDTPPSPSTYGGSSPRFFYDDGSTTMQLDDDPDMEFDFS
jgi:hypothetical protein